MAKRKKKTSGKNPDWATAKTLCRLSAVEIQMAKELGMTPKSLTKNIPSRSQQWKASVKDWVRGLYEKKFGDRVPKVPTEFQNPNAKQKPSKKPKEGNKGTTNSPNPLRNDPPICQSDDANDDIPF